MGKDWAFIGKYVGILRELLRLYFEIILQQFKQSLNYNTVAKENRANCGAVYGV